MRKYKSMEGHERRVSASYRNKNRSSSLKSQSMNDAFALTRNVDRKRYRNSL